MGNEDKNCGLKFHVEKMYRLSDGGNLRAFADVSINGALVIRGVRVLCGKKGLFLTMPQEQGKDNKWYDQVVCREAGIYDALSTTVLSFYEQGLTGARCDALKG